jgi:TonB family protein
MRSRGNYPAKTLSLQNFRAMRILMLAFTLLGGCTRDSDEIKKLNDEVAKLKEDARQQQLEKEAQALSNTKINGSVFVVSRNGAIFKLALVPVVVVDSLSYAAFVKSERETMLTEIAAAKTNIKDAAQRASGYRQAYRDALHGFQDKQTALDEASEGLSRFAVIDDTQRKITLNPEAGSIGIEKAKAYNDAREGLFAQGSLLIAIHSDLEKCYEDDAKYRIAFVGPIAKDSTRNFPLQLPNSYSTETDGDGKFTASVKRSADVVIMARGQRDLPEGTENYYWTVPVHGTMADDQITVMLSNDNLVGSTRLLTDQEVAQPESLEPIDSIPAFLGDRNGYAVTIAPVAPASPATPPQGEAGSLGIEVPDIAPVPIRQVAPIYPYEMRRAGVSGEVLVDFIIDTDGNVKGAFAAQSSQREFEAAAIEAVNKWKFHPAIKNGHPVFTHMQTPITFSLSADN